MLKDMKNFNPLIVIYKYISYTCITKQLTTNRFTKHGIKIPIYIVFVHALNSSSKNKLNYHFYSSKFSPQKILENI